VLNIKDTVDQHTEILAQHTETLNQHTEELAAIEPRWPTTATDSIGSKTTRDVKVISSPRFWRYSAEDHQPATGRTRDRCLIGPVTPARVLTSGTADSSGERSNAMNPYLLRCGTVLIVPSPPLTVLLNSSPETLTAGVAAVDEVGWGRPSSAIPADGRLFGSLTGGTSPSWRAEMLRGRARLGCLNLGTYWENSRRPGRTCPDQPFTRFTLVKGW
jgi:hypothetical protein